MDKSSNKWFLFLKPNPAALRLFCFHYAGWSAQVFHGWPGSLPPNGKHDGFNRRGADTDLASIISDDWRRSASSWRKSCCRTWTSPLFSSAIVWERYCALKRCAACAKTKQLAAWSETAVRACETQMFPGSHDYLNSSLAIFLQIFAGDLLRLRLQN